MDGFPPQDEALMQHLSAQCAYTPGKETFRVHVRGMTQPMTAEGLTGAAAVLVATEKSRRGVTVATRDRYRPPLPPCSVAAILPATRAREHRSPRTARTSRSSSSADDPGPGEGVGAARRDALRRRAATIEARLCFNKAAIPATVFAEAAKGFTGPEKEVVRFWMPAASRAAIVSEVE
jgi:hypothetical protein